MYTEELTEARSGPLGLIRDMQDLYMLVSFVDVTWALKGRAGRAVRDPEVFQALAAGDHETCEQLALPRARIKQAASQALVVGRTRA